jgi:NADH-quinone oxidoreductase subunit D
VTASSSTGPQAPAGASDADEEAAEGRVYTVSGEDWDEFVAANEARDFESGERIVINMGPQHPSTHGVLRLILTLEGETVAEVRASIGYLHTGIEKNMEYRTWTQGTTFCTRMDYLMPFFNEAAYCLATEKLLGIEDKIPEKAQIIRVLMMELNRISSHLQGIGPMGMELGATTIFLQGLRLRERILDIYELITGLRMNHAYIRPGGVAQDLPPGALDQIREFLGYAPKLVKDLRTLIDANTVFIGRTKGVAYLDLAGCMALGITGPMLRSTGLPWDLRKSQPYCGYETYDFDVPVADTCDAYGRYIIRMDEIAESLKIIRQCVDRLAARGPGGPAASSGGDPVMIRDAKIGWPAQLSLGPDGLGPSPEHIAHIMGGSMEALIHHFKIITEGFRVPAGQVYAGIESARGELGAHVVSDGGTRPYRVHFRDPSFNNLQAISAVCEGGQVADVIPAIASIDPVMGGVDR